MTLSPELACSVKAVFREAHRNSAAFAVFLLKFCSICESLDTRFNNLVPIYIYCEIISEHNATLISTVSPFYSNLRPDCRVRDYAKVNPTAQVSLMPCSCRRDMFLLCRN